jgi:branched-chain amino acid transport system ATP-binding protein
MRDSEAILEVSNLSVFYGEAQILYDIEMSIGKKNRVVALLGRNGSGKTTLLRSIAGVIRPTRGKISFLGQDITLMPAWKRALLGLKYIPPDKRVFTSLTVYENLRVAAYGLLRTSNSTIVDKEIEKVLEIFPRLRKLLNNKALYLSGGERQILNLAMSMMGPTKLLMLDEPTEGLAPALVQFFSELLDKIRTDFPIFLIEQNLPIIRRLADSLYLMKEGRIIYHTDDINTIRGGEYMKLL